MQQLFDFAFARLDRAESKRREFGESWAQYISHHPWDIDVRNVTPTTFEILAVTREQAPVQISLAFSDWLATIRAALDNGLYAWVAAATGQNPPPLAERIQYPICSTAKEYASQRKRLSGVPEDILDKLEAAQPYQSPYGPESNLFYWIHELARTDRHRSLHVGLGRVGAHRIRLRLPGGVTATFDESVKPYHHIVDELVIGRFTTSKAVSRFAIEADLTGVGIDPEVQAWAAFTMAGQRPSLQKRMIYTELFTRNNLENMALFSGIEPLGGFTTLDPSTGL
ncbi:hypothetical protein V1639_13300 [Pseudarthrobacter sp. J75]|uniref:hypothetical protein n=1 Tax=unclassified Pseudarthrobacter TaxID=2647000 RepID=UPI002E822954|nr:MULTISPECIES: hypothetical protein [unclassified Pseudarthrobacter]MEE2523605.1 hypothetical protein [Pseudarthrobacter sp. J47]MEE2529995.1 hypothetical protein [Pseudarthrobacter sp. J75]MEE2570595.1 hypothetical protein [Pseudarthrobacter sp. J64]